MSTSVDDLTPLKQTLADLLATLRDEARMTQQQVADQIGYARSRCRLTHSRGSDQRAGRLGGTGTPDAGRARRTRTSRIGSSAGADR
jgi:hypothetical protein